VRGLEAATKQHLPGPSVAADCPPLPSAEEDEETPHVEKSVLLHAMQHAERAKLVRATNLSTHLVWADRFEEEIALWHDEDGVNFAALADEDRTMAACHLALVEFLRRLAGYEHKAQELLEDLQTEAGILRDLVTNEKEAALEAEEAQQGVAWSMMRRVSDGVISAVSTLSGQGQEDMAAAPPRVRLASICEALAEGLIGILIALEVLEAGIASPGNMKKAIQAGMKVRRCFRELRVLSQSSPHAEGPVPSTRTALCVGVEVDSHVEALILDLHRFICGTFCLASRSATAQWVLRAIGLHADREEGLWLLRNGSKSTSPLLRLCTFSSLAYYRLMEAEELQLLGFSAAAAEAAQEAFQMEAAIRREFPEGGVPRKHGAKLGMHIAFDLIRTGSSRMESRLLWCPDQATDATGRVRFGKGPDVEVLEDLAGEESRGCDFRLHTIWEAVLHELGAWDLDSLVKLLPLVIEDAWRFVSTSEAARGCVRNGSMLLAAVKTRLGEMGHLNEILGEVEQLQAKYELEGQLRTTLRCKLLRCRPEQPCVATLALLEDLYKYRLLQGMRDFAPLKVDLEVVHKLLDEMPDSWVAFELDLAVELWTGVIARAEGNHKLAEERLVGTIELADENGKDLRQIPSLYHVHLAWTELMCLRIDQGERAMAGKCRRLALQAMHKEIERTSVIRSKSDSGGWAFGLDDFASGLRKLFISPSHPLHPNCPFYFWQTMNVLDTAGRELAALAKGAKNGDAGDLLTTDEEEWRSDIESDAVDEFFSDPEQEEDPAQRRAERRGKCPTEGLPAEHW